MDDRDERLGALRPERAGRRLPFAAVNLISDPIHGYLELTKRLAPADARAADLHEEAVAEDDLLDTAWVQRLRRISQLQSARWVFPTAEHSRFTHGLGVMHQAALWARGEALSATPTPGDGTVTRDVADGWRAILLRRPRWRAELEVRAAGETDDWPPALVAELGKPEPGRVVVDLIGVDARPGAGKAAPLAIEGRDGSPGPSIAEALGRLPAWSLVGRRYRRAG